MTVPVQQIFSAYTGDGVTTSFNLACKVYLAADCQAFTYTPGVSTVPTILSSGVTWSVASDFSSATATISPAPASGVKVGLIRRMDLTQNVSVSNTNYVPPNVMEQALDRQMMAIQEAVWFATLPLQSDPFGFTVSARAGSVPSYDSNGNQTWVLDPFPMQGTWSASTSYAYRNVVTLNGEGFISRISNNLNNNPLTDNGTNWQPLSPATFTMRNGSGAPAGGLGNDGDFYIDTTAHAIYGPRSGGVWGSATSLVGPTGATGSPGVNGQTIWNGSGAPSAGTGANGDFYIDTTAHAIYGPKTAGAWGSGTNLVGPAGSGNVSGPGSSTAGHMATFADATGKVLQDGGAPFNGAYGSLSGLPTLGTIASHAAMVAGDLYKKTVGAALTADLAFGDAAPVALTYSATITPDLKTGINFTVTLTGAATLALPANQQVGQCGVIYVTQDATGGRTLAYAAGYKFAGGTAPILSTAANAVDRLTYFVRAANIIDIDASYNRA